MLDSVIVRDDNHLIFGRSALAETLSGEPRKIQTGLLAPRSDIQRVINILARANLFHAKGTRRKANSLVRHAVGSAATRPGKSDEVHHMFKAGAASKRKAPDLETESRKKKKAKQVDLWQTGMSFTISSNF